MPTAFKYRAFLSYAHADTPWATWLHGKLERHHIDRDLVGRETAMGPVPRTLRPIFRDREDFSGGQTLRDATIAALDQSAALVVLCSPVAASRPAVNEEIRLFRHSHPRRPVIPVIIEGTPPHCFPQALQYDLAPDGSVVDTPVTILGPDLRESGDGRNLGLAKVIAALLGVPSDDVYRRSERERRQRQRNWIIGLSVVVAALTGLAGWAEINRREAVAQRVNAEKNFAVAKNTVNTVLSDIAVEMRKAVKVPIESKRRIFIGVERAMTELAKAAPGDLEVRRSQVRLMTEVGGIYFDAGEIPSAYAAYMYIDRSARELAEAHPKDLMIQREYLLLLAGIADVYAKQGMRQQALTSVDQMTAVVRGALSVEPGNEIWSKALALTLQKKAQLSGYER